MLDTAFSAANALAMVGWLLFIAVDRAFGRTVGATAQRCRARS